MLKRVISTAIYLSKIFVITTRRFFLEKYTYRVSALAFTSLLSLVPLLSLCVFFATIVPEFNYIISIAQDYIFKYFMPNVANSLEVYFHNFIQQTVKLPTLSIIFLFVTLLLVINTIDETINDIWHVSIKKRGLIVWLFYGVILLIAPILIGFSVFLTSYIFSFYLFSKISWILLLILPILVNTIIFSLFYLFVPNAPVRIRDGILGGFVVALLTELARVIFAIYISHLSNYELIYGAFAILPIFLVWLYVCWFIILWGCVFVNVLTRQETEYTLKKIPDM